MKYEGKNTKMFIQAKNIYLFSKTKKTLQNVILDILN